MKEAWSYVVTNLRSYIGDDWILWGCFCLALIVCFFLGDDNRKKVCYVGVLACVVVINPIVYFLIGQKFLSGVYWRLFWVIPVVITIAVVLTELVMHIKKEMLRIVIAFIICIVIAKVGVCVFRGGTYQVAENEYQIPQSAVSISDIILEHSEGQNVKVVVPNEMVTFVRQYTSKVQLLYGRNIWGFINTATVEQREVYEAMNAEELDLEMLFEKAVYLGGNYIVFNINERKLPDDMETYGYQYIGEYENYEVYWLEY